ncbi:MAG: hypothetical protein KDC84_01485 [Crocinitomicaceae bacterium]|nr:hypothetical protein [Crocinitomicaceae bacterium]
MMHRKSIAGWLAFVLLFSSLALSQEVKEPKDFRTTDGGTFSLGMRTTGSFFGVDGNPGFGFGGQFRIQLLRWLNTEWFADYITTDIGGMGKREDYHIGWSVMFYPFKFKQKWFQPYLLAGHCFDYTRVTAYSTATIDNSDKTQSRWSAAAQIGLGTHFHIGRRFDIGLSGQYMFHLGKEIHADIIDNAGSRELQVETHQGNILEGHLLVTLNFNVKIADLWKSKKQ